MKNIMPLIAMTALTSLSANPATAPQQPRVHKVLVLPEDTEAVPVASALRARIGSTLRYELGDDDDSDIWVDIQCVKDTVGGRVTGRSCATTYFYRPARLNYPSIYLIAGVSSGPLDVASMVDGIFEGLVDETSESKLAKKSQQFVDSIRSACSLHLGNKNEVTSACSGN